MKHGSLARFLLVASLCIVHFGAAENAAARTATGPERGLLLEILEAVYPAELVMRHADKLSLDDAQREAIIAEVQSLQNDLVPLQWGIHEEGEKLRQGLDAARVDEAKVLEQASRVMALEQKIKTRHLAMLVRVKNILTSEQQEILDDQRLLPRLGRLRRRLESGLGLRPPSEPDTAP